MIRDVHPGSGSMSQKGTKSRIRNTGYPGTNFTDCRVESEWSHTLPSDGNRWLRGRARSSSWSATRSTSRDSSISSWTTWRPSSPSWSTRVEPLSGRRGFRCITLFIYKGLVGLVLRMRIRIRILISRVRMFFGPPGSGSFYHKGNKVRKTLWK